MPEKLDKRKCGRCGRLFTPRDPEQRYGPKCAKNVWVLGSDPDAQKAYTEARLV